MGPESPTPPRRPRLGPIPLAPKLHAHVFAQHGRALTPPGWVRVVSVRVTFAQPDKTRLLVALGTIVRKAPERGAASAQAMAAYGTLARDLAVDALDAGADDQMDLLLITTAPRWWHPGWWLARLRGDPWA